jgi:hypothetical protein
MGQNSPVPDPTPAPPAPPAPPPPDPELARLQAENAAQARQLALAQTRIDFPQADAAILGMFQGSPEDLRKMAESLHAKELERQAALSHSSGPAPTPGPGGTPSPEDAVRARYEELKRKVLGRYADPAERDEFENLSFGRGWNQHMSDRKSNTSTGFTGARA